ncbi:N-6 DNA methylase [Streptomyces sp. Li-HN-5-11]|uniref:N-6 DNA methylase n=1 Tax=Streptomyces sp. Li-HN-5-11 TaxID=3075432 RepID=UPI0028AE8885|nr:N-6 DNA methylase [Streptomyces sp. Li-HN-5-11]WNM29076.1 N-6 DNA methylase [Streptomyces sp. Li-HN-5-11]
MVTATYEQRRAVLAGVLAQCGYVDRLIREDFPVWPVDGRRVRADFVAFAQVDQQDLSTSAIMAAVVDYEAEIRGHWVEAAASLATPAMLIALPDRLSLWRVSVDNEKTREIQTAPIGSENLIVRELASLTPEAVSRAKLNFSQNPLFPVDLELFEQSRKKNRSYLTEQVEAAMQAADESMQGQSSADVSRLVIGALAVLMLRDKGQVTDGPPAVLIDVAQQRYPGYFDWLNHFSPTGIETFDSIVREIGDRVNFAGLEPAMVSDVYEQALVTHSQRREQGTYYTPPAVAKQLLEMVPIETIHPQNRFILDPACGSGTMLLAASDRLKKLQPAEADALERHRYITSHLRGYDQDLFATEVTKLSLLMTALPSGNSWRVESRDALAQNLDAQDRPSIMVSNPPWQHTRRGKPAVERADAFIDWMLDNLVEDGFLACVLPLSWVKSKTSKSARTNLLERATLIEMWRLPSETFQSTTDAIAPAVIIAQKKTGGHRGNRVTLVKRVSGRVGALSRFLETGIPDYSYTTLPGKSGEGLLEGPLTRFFKQHPGVVPLGDVALIRNGRPHEPGRPKRKESEATHWELSSLRDLKAFGSPDESRLIPVKYPEDFSKTGQSDGYMRSAKVLVVAKRWNTSNPWRIKAGVDLRGVVPRETFHMAIPNADWSGWEGLASEDRLFSILAVLGSGMASCWVDEREPGRNISPTTIQALPIPATRESLIELAKAGRKMSRAVASGKLSAMESAAIGLEETIAYVYGLTEDVVQVIRQSLQAQPAPEGVIRYACHAPSSEVSRSGFMAPTFGHVLEADEHGLRVWVSGVTDDEGVRMKPPLRAPGWLCQPGVDFQVSGDLKDLVSARFGLHTFDWLPTDEYGDPGMENDR